MAKDTVANLLEAALAFHRLAGSGAVKYLEQALKDWNMTRGCSLSDAGTRLMYPSDAEDCFPGEDTYELIACATALHGLATETDSLLSAHPAACVVAYAKHATKLYRRLIARARD